MAENQVTGHVAKEKEEVVIAEIHLKLLDVGGKNKVDGVASGSGAALADIFRTMLVRQPDVRDALFVAIDQYRDIQEQEGGGNG